MTMLTAMFTMLAFAAVYALIAAMLGENFATILAALRGGGANHPVGMTRASRAFNRA